MFMSSIHGGGGGTKARLPLGDVLGSVRDSLSRSEGGLVVVGYEAVGWVSCMHACKPVSAG